MSTWAPAEIFLRGSKPLRLRQMGHVPSLTGANKTVYSFEDFRLNLQVLDASAEGPITKISGYFEIGENI